MGCNTERAFSKKNSAVVVAFFSFSFPPSPSSPSIGETFHARKEHSFVPSRIRERRSDEQQRRFTPSSDGEARDDRRLRTREGEGKRMDVASEARPAFFFFPIFSFVQASKASETEAIFLCLLH